MKWKKQIAGYMMLLLCYMGFTFLCCIFHWGLEEYRAWISCCWYFGTLLFGFVNAIIWVLLLKKIME